MATVPSTAFNLIEHSKAIVGERPTPLSLELSTRSEIAPRDAVLRALKRVLESDVFRQSIRLSQFLRFTVEQTLQGFGENLKEYRIATEIYGRRSDFDPAQDTIVRSEARRLRKKLREYYEGDGKDDAVVITFRPGSYVPVSRWRASLATPSPISAKSGGAQWDCDDEVQVVVKPFQAHPGDPLAAALAFGVSDEILHRLMRIAGIRVVWHSTVEQHRSLARDGAPEITIDGAVRTGNGQLRVTARVTTADCLMLWSQRFDAEIDADTLMKFPELVGASLVTRISPRRATPRGYDAHRSYLCYSEALAAETLLEAGSIASVSAALERFEALAAGAPGYARPHSGIAQCCVVLSQCGADRWQESNRKGKKAALTALSADPGTAQAHSAMGCLLAQEWKWQEAEDSFRTALHLGDAHIAHRQYSQLLLAQKRFDEAWKHLQRADETDPFSALQQLSKARFLYYSRRHREAGPYYGWLAQHGPLPLEIRVLQVLTEIERSDRSRARVLAEGIHKAAVTGGPVYLALAAEVFALCEETHVACSLIANRGLLEKGTPISCFRKARLALSLKDRAQGLSFLRESWQHREPELLWIAVDPRFDDIRSEDEYLTICDAVFHSGTASRKAAERAPILEPTADLPGIV